MRLFPRVRFLLSTLLLLLLIACGENVPGVQELKLTGVSPARGSLQGGTRVTISGDGLFASDQPGFVGELSASVCGAPLTDLQVMGGTSRRFVMPGGGVGSITEGATITGITGPMSAGGGAVVVTRPDGQSATLEGAFDCFDPAPVVERFEHETTTGEARSFEPLTFRAAASDPDGQALTCRLDPGDGAAPYAFADCRAPLDQPHTYSAPGSYTAVLTVSNASATTTRELLVAVAELGVPTAADDQYRALAGYRLTVAATDGVLANDTLRSAALTAHDATSARGGAVAVAADGSFTFDPNPAAGPLPYTDTFTYTVGSPAGSATATVSVAVALPPASASASSVSVDRATLTADGADSSTVTVILRDEHGRQLLAGIAGDVSLAVEPASATLSPIVDNGDGSYTATLTAPDRSGAATLTAYVEGQALPGSVALAFVAGPAHALAAVGGDGATLAVASAHTLTALVTDAHGNPVEGVDIQWTTAFGSLGAAATATGADGHASVTWELGAAPGVQSVSATAAGASGALAGAPLTFSVTAVSGAVDPARSTIEAASSTLTAGGTGTTITVTLFDSHGNRLGRGGDTVRLALSGGGALASTEPADAGDGSYQTTFTPTTSAGTSTITATVDGEAIAGSATITVRAAAAHSLRLELGGSEPRLAGVGQPLTVTAFDEFGNVADAWAGRHAIVFGGAGAAPDGSEPTAADHGAARVAFGAETELEFSAGVAITTVTFYEAGAVALIANHAASAVATASPIDFGVLPGAATTLVVAPASVELLTVGATADLEASFADAYGNTVVFSDFAWSSSDEGVASVAGSGAAATVEAVGGGNATVTVSTTLDAAFSATTTVHVNLAPSAAGDDYAFSHTLGSNTYPAPGVLGNDALGNPPAEVQSFGVGAGDVPAGGSLALAGGTVSVAADGAVTFAGTFTPGQYEFAYRIANAHGNSDATVALTVIAAPVALGDAFTVLNDGAELRADLLQNDALGFPAATISSWGGGDLAGSYQPGASVAAFGGTVSVVADGTVTFDGPLTPGTYEFDYEITNSAGSSSATVTLDVHQLPMAAADVVTAKVGEVLAVNLLANDDPGRPAATLVSFGSGSLGGTAATLAAGSEVDLAGGKLTLAADGALTLSGHTDDGEYTFAYVLSNAAGSSVGTVTLEAKAPPVAVDDGPGAASAPGDPFHTAMGTPLNVGAAAGLLANDTLNDPAAAIESFGEIVLVDGVGTPAAPLGTITSYAAGATVPLGADGSLNVTAGGALAFSPPTGYTGPVTFRYRLTNDAGSAEASVTLAVGVRPATVADTYDVLGNVGIDVPAAESMLANDVGDALRFVSYASANLPGTSAASTDGGAFRASPDGAFAFEPAAGSQGDDGIEYVVANGFGSVTGTITFEVADAIWFVDAGAPEAGDGTLARPFRSLAEMTAVDAAASAPHQAIFFHGSTTPYDGDVIQLKDGQRLIGQHAFGSLADLADVTPPPYSRALPVLDPSGPLSQIRGGGTRVSLARDNHLYGLILGSDAGTQATLTGTGFGTLTVRDTAIVSGAAGLISLTNGAVDAEFDEVSGGIAPRHVTLAGVAGSLRVGTGTLQGASEANITVTDSNLSFTFGGNVHNGSGGHSLVVTGNSPTVVLSGDLQDMGRGVRVANLSGGSVTLSGPRKEFRTGSHHAISFTDSPAAQFRLLGGGLDILTSTGQGMFASGGGSIAVTGEGNSVTSGSGTAVHVDTTTISPEGMRFRSISHAGGANGVFLSGTGNGSFTVTGAGVAGSGGTISNVFGSDATSAGNSFYFVDAANISLAHMDVVDSSNHGLFAERVNGLTLTGMAFSGNHGTTADGRFTEGAVKLLDVGGTVSATGSTFNGGFANAFRVLNTAPRALTLRYSDNTVSRMQGSREDVGGTALLVDIWAGSADIAIERNTFTYWWGNAIDVLVRGSATGVTRITDNLATNTSGALAASGGIRVSGGDHSYRIANNTVIGTDGTAISADRSREGRLLSGSILNNSIGDSAIPSSATVVGRAIFASHFGPGETVVRIDGNTIRRAPRNSGGTITLHSAETTASGGPGRFDAIVTGNDIRDYSDGAGGALIGLLVTLGATGGDSDVGCFDIGGPGAFANTFDDGANLVRIRVNQRFDTTSYFPGYMGPQLQTESASALASYLAGRNTGPNLASANANGSTGGFLNAASCRAPAL